MTPPRSMPEVVDAIVQALADIRYGSIEITIHEGRVVQIERRERVRVAGGNTAS